MLIAQLTDLHVGPEDDPACAGNFARFVECLALLKRALRRPDLLLVTGDITERGDRPSYARFFAAIEELRMSWIATLGNHDDPASFSDAAADAALSFFKPEDVFESGDWRIVLVDTRQTGLDGGYFDASRARLLDDVLEGHRGMLTFVAMHHPPVATGIGWIDPAPDAGWVQNVSEVLLRHRQIRHITCGHVHMPVMTRLGDIPLSIAPATAPQLWPELSAFNPAKPDGRAMVVEGAPGFALHQLGPRGVTTLFCSARPGPMRLAHTASSDPAAVTRGLAATRW